MTCELQLGGRRAHFCEIAGLLRLARAESPVHQRNFDKRMGFAYIAAAFFIS
jgi:hypothetical protein